MNEDIKQKIADEYPSDSDNKFYNAIREEKRAAAEYGYSLAEQEIERLRDEKQSLQILLDACKQATAYPLTQQESEEELWSVVTGIIGNYEVSLAIDQLKHHFTISRKTKQK